MSGAMLAARRRDAVAVMSHEAGGARPPQRESA
jgi:hypothetical protein